LSLLPLMPDQPHSVIAVDGTAASGKSTFARALAARLGYIYVNTGTMYRGVTWYVQQKGISLEDHEAVARAMENAKVEMNLYERELLFRIDGLDPLPHVREARVNEGVSLVSQVVEVRKILVAEQQKPALLHPLVMEGRDIGTVVFPQTPYKFYIDANPMVRAQRRKDQGEIDVVQRRDKIDQQRVTSPLTRAADALFLDSGHSSVEELVVKALQHLKDTGLKGTF
jgi:cytidylate kinase